jgi:hypothetical protein
MGGGNPKRSPGFGRADLNDAANGIQCDILLEKTVSNPSIVEYIHSAGYWEDISAIYRLQESGSGFIEMEEKPMKQLKAFKQAVANKGPPFESITWQTSEKNPELAEANNNDNSNLSETSETE